MIIGATGGAGRLAIKMARLLGAGRVIAAGRQRDILATLDADAIIDLSLPPQDLKQAFVAAIPGSGVIVDYIWGPVAEILLDAFVSHDLAAQNVGDGIRLISVGAMAGPTINLSSSALRGSRMSLLGSGTANFPPLPQLKTFVADILAHACRGALHVEVERYLLAEIEEAWAATAQSKKRIVFTLTKQL